ncbi:serine/threonine-protein phosphatase 4 regulatory subunit 4 [Angomonas deanei]|nr:serine/threonine-protein phosphatase 4 regulatory subunit 4 [Angomonas deanei]|eukprot:EPY25457.1 serine/threonine-protein phosphatase 4 regulatory subunit 4 [Angomonas deanei]
MLSSLSLSPFSISIVRGIVLFFFLLVRSKEQSMDYKSPFEIRRQFLEEARAAKSPQKMSPHKRQKPISDSTSSNSSQSSNLNLSSIPDDPTALVREVPGAENIKALNASRERDEAVQRYMENESLSLEDSARYIMQNGSTTQRIGFFSHVRESLVDLTPKQISVVLNILLDSMWAQDPDIQCSAPESIATFLGLLNHSVSKDLFEVTRTMLTVKMPAVRKAWGVLLLQLLEFISTDLLVQEVIPLAVRKSEHAETQDQRELSCSIFGTACQYLSVENVELLILPRATALCQDTNVGVRQCMCQQLGNIARGLGVEKAKESIAPNLFELLSDEERVVSRCAFSSLLDLVEFFGADYRKEKLFPIIKNFISDPPSEVISLLLVEFGRFLHEIKGDITTEEDAELFADFYYTASMKSNEESRKHCSYNLPAVAASLPIEKFPSYIAPCLDSFATDPNLTVRRPVAAGLHELVPILGNDAYKYMESPVLSLIKDNDRQVRNLLFDNLVKIVDHFRCTMPPSQKRAFFEKMGNALMKLVPEGKSYWYNMKHFLFFVSRYVSEFSEGLIVDQFIPSTLSYMKVGANNLKPECAHVFAILLLRVETPSSCVHIINKINNEFAHSTSCYDRVSFFRIVGELCKYFSRRFVRERLLESSLELQTDKVPIVRLNLARVLVSLSKGLRPQNPGSFEEDFKNMMKRFGEDGVPEVREAAAAGQKAMDKLEKERAKDGKGSCKEDIEDQKREKREQPMLDLAKESDKAERRTKLRNLLKNEREKEVAEMTTTPLRTQLKSASKTKKSAALPPISSSQGKVSSANSSVPSSYVRRRL